MESVEGEETEEYETGVKKTLVVRRAESHEGQGKKDFSILEM